MFILSRKHFLTIIIMAAALTAFSSCDDRLPPVATGSGIKSPSIRIVSPENYASIQTTVNTRNITVKVETANFKLVSKIGEPNVAGEGYIIYYLDVNPPTAPGKPALTANGSFVQEAVTSHKWSNLSDGPHMLAAELVNNDGTPLSTPATDWIQTFLQFDILAPNVKITAPVDGGTIPAGDVTVKIEIHDFIISGRVGEPNLSGEGHLHYFIDVDPPVEREKLAETAVGTWAESLNDTFTWHNVSPGTHTFAVELVTNDHMPLYPPSLRPAYDEVTVTVTASNRY